jgi:hypothetical protein|tara:strand:+ start:604 stop:843 length:240 start_codon:yes stop_codon:yes gene_type:complete
MYTNNPIKPTKIWLTRIKEDPELGPYLEIPPELLETLGWTEGTQVEWSETEICSDTGEHQGLVLEKILALTNPDGAEDN